MPTGVAIRDVREQLFAAAERVLLRDGANALTSRAVTAEAGCAKGVLHRHFTDFDAFLAELVADRVAWLGGRAAELRGSAGTGTVEGNVTAALGGLFEPVAVAIVGLVVSRDELRARLRRAGLPGVPVLAQAGAMISGYLDAECALGRVAADTDAASLALSLVGAAHLLATARDPAPPPGALPRVVATVLADVRQRRLL